VGLKETLEMQYVYVCTQKAPGREKQTNTWRNRRSSCSPLGLLASQPSCINNHRTLCLLTSKASALDSLYRKWTGWFFLI